MWSPCTTVDEELTDHIRSAIASLPDAPVSGQLERRYAARESDTRPVLLEPLPAGFHFGRRMKVKLGCWLGSFGERVGSGAGDDESKRRLGPGGLPRDLLS
jgi:hypothetical protein